MLNKILHTAVDWLERVVAALLVVIAVLGAVDLVVELYNAVSTRGYLTPDSILRVLDSVLVVFIVVELFNIAVAYMNRKHVLTTVMEAGLVAVVRKLVIFESTGAPADVLLKAVALSLLMVSVAVTWFLLRKSEACTAPAHLEAEAE